MKKIRERLIKHLKNNKGFTFVELLVAVAILGVCLAPIMSTFVVTSRINMKGRRQEQAMTVAQNLVEGVKAFGIEKTLLACDSANTDPFTLIPENVDTVTISHSVTKSVLVSSVIDVTGYELMNGNTINGGANTTVTTKSSEYEMKITNVLVGATYYDAVISIVPNYDKEYVVSYFYEQTFIDAGMSNLKYYDVTVVVSMHGTTDPLATYTGTIVDQK